MPSRALPTSQGTMCSPMNGTLMATASTMMPQARPLHGCGTMTVCFQLACGFLMMTGGSTSIHPLLQYTMLHLCPMQEDPILETKAPLSRLPGPTATRAQPTQYRTSGTSGTAAIPLCRTPHMSIPMTGFILLHSLLQMTMVQVSPSS